MQLYNTNVIINNSYGLDCSSHMAWLALE